MLLEGDTDLGLPVTVNHQDVVAVRTVVVSGSHCLVGQWVTKFQPAGVRVVYPSVAILEGYMKFRELPDQISVVDPLWFVECGLDDMFEG